MIRKVLPITMLMLAGCSGASKPAPDPFDAQFDADVEAIWQRAEDITDYPREEIPWATAIGYFGIDNNSLLATYAQRTGGRTMSQLRKSELGDLYTGLYEAMLKRCKEKKLLPSKNIDECRKAVDYFIELKIARWN